MGRAVIGSGRGRPDPIATYNPASAIASELLSNKFLPTTGSNSLSFCHFGPLGKSSILPFQLSNFASNNPLDLIHFDVWSSPIASMRGSKYYAL